MNKGCSTAHDKPDSQGRISRAGGCDGEVGEELGCAQAGREACDLKVSSPPGAPECRGARPSLGMATAFPGRSMRC